MNLMTNGYNNFSPRVNNMPNGGTMNPPMAYNYNQAPTSIFGKIGNLAKQALRNPMLMGTGATILGGIGSGLLASGVGAPVGIAIIAAGIGGGVAGNMGKKVANHFQQKDMANQMQQFSQPLCYNTMCNNGMPNMGSYGMMPGVAYPSNTAYNMPTNGIQNSYMPQMTMSMPNMNGMNNGMQMQMMMQMMQTMMMMMQILMSGQQNQGSNYNMMPLNTFQQTAAPRAFLGVSPGANAMPQFQTPQIQVPQVPNYNVNNIFVNNGSNSAPQSTNVPNSAPAVNPFLNSSTKGSHLANSALAWAGSSFKPGMTKRCADFVSTVIEKSGAAPKGFKHQVSCNQLQKYGTAVSKKDLQPGDIVYFKNTYRKGNFTHVGIYIGDGKYVHRPTANKPVKIGNLNSKYGNEHYSCARRLG